MSLQGCKTSTVEVSEILNHNFCSTLPEGVRQVEFADLAAIVGAKLLEGEIEDPATDASSAAASSIFIAIYKGVQPTLGHGFDLNKAEAKGDEIALHYTWRTPTADTIVPQVLSQPCSVVELRGPELPRQISVWLNGEPYEQLALTE